MKFKIYEHINKSLYNCVIHHPQGVQSPIFNYCLKMKIDVHTEPQLVPNILPQVSVREHNNNLFSDTDNGGIK